MDCRKQKEKSLIIHGGIDADENIKNTNSNKPILHEKSGHQDNLLNYESVIISTKIKTTNH